VAHPETVAVYEAVADDYRARRKAYDPDRAVAFAAAVPPGGVRLDLGCGPGLYADLHGRPLVAGDVALAMCRATRAAAPDVPVLRLDVEALPLRPGSVIGTWAWKSLQHLPADRLPGALAEIHRAMPVGGRLEVALFRGERGGVYEERRVAEDDFPGRLFTWWEPEPLRHLLVGAGFDVDDLAVTDRTIKVTATRARTLPDVVGPGLRLLVCGLNPSLYAADAGVAYARPGNRFWPAALAAGLVTVDRDPWHALRHCGVGFTDLAKRATVRADEVAAGEYRDGLARLEHLCALVRPAALAVCGLGGWRVAADRRAVAGWQHRTVGGTPVYVLPNPSGLNAHARLDTITEHLRTAATTAPPPGIERGAAVGEPRGVAAPGSPGRAP
jgi:TDG/mug DNA glycosylase family protein